MARRSYSGNAKETTLTSDIVATSTNIPIADATGWPDGTNGPFFVAIGKGTATEEKMLATGRTGLNLTVPLANRGQDNTTAAAHAAGVAVEHVGTATDLDEANAHVNNSTADPHSVYLLKAGGTMSGDLALGGNDLTGAVLSAYDELIDARGAVTTNQSVDGETPIVRMTLGAAITVTVGLAAGESVTLELTQDATGGRVVTWSGVTWAGGTAPTLSTAAGAVDVLTFVHTGSGVRGFMSGKAFA